MNNDEILALFDREQRREVDFYGLRREVTPDVVRHVSLVAEGRENMVIYSRLTPDNVDEVIRTEIAYFEEIGHTFEWTVYDHDTPPDLKERLVAYGFEIEEPEALLVLDLTQTPSPLLEPVRHNIRRITDPAQVGDVVAVQQQVWPEADYITWLVQRLSEILHHDSEHLSIYVAYVDDVPASSAWISFHEGSQFAGLWGGSTLPEYRQRGLYTALVATRLQEARRRGVRFLTIDARPMSHAVLKKYGFQLLTYCHPCKWRVGAAHQEK